MPTTSASPIISAVAVAAVRLGLERAESAASRPSTGASRRTGHDRTRVSGAIRNGAISAIPKKIAIVPADAGGDHGVGGLVGGAEQEGPGEARERSSRRRRRRAAARGRFAHPLGAQHGPDRRDPPGPASAGSARRAPRSAGRSRPRRSSAIGVSSSVADREVDRRASARSGPAPAAPRARARATAPITPSAAASSRTERTIIGRVAPSVRCMPISRMRWSTVMLKLLKIRKPPTNSAMPAKK